MKQIIRSQRSGKTSYMKAVLERYLVNKREIKKVLLDMQVFGIAMFKYDKKGKLKRVNPIKK